MVANGTDRRIAVNGPNRRYRVLFYDFLLSDAQPILAGRQFVAVSRKIESTFKGPIKLIDSAMMLDQSRKWQDLYQRTIVGPSR
jgi:iron(III) transport system substrate-binding protein